MDTVNITDLILLTSIINFVIYFYILFFYSKFNLKNLIKN